MVVSRELERCIGKIPRFMHPEIERIKTWNDLVYQVQLEVDLAKSGELRWTPRQWRTALLFLQRAKDRAIEAGEIPEEYEV